MKIIPCAIRSRKYAGLSAAIEIRKDGISNALTSLWKDYLILIIDDELSERDSRNKREILSSRI